jgi:hypothetical protein
LRADCRGIAVPLTAVTSIRRAMPDDKTPSCECGYRVTAADEAGRVEEVRTHAQQAHGIAFSAEDALLVLLRSELALSRDSSEAAHARRASRGGMQ